MNKFNYFILNLMFPVDSKALTYKYLRHLIVHWSACLNFANNIANTTPLGNYFVYIFSFIAFLDIAAELFVTASHAQSLQVKPNENDEIEILVLKLVKDAMKDPTDIVMSITSFCYCIIVFLFSNLTLNALFNLTIVFYCTKLTIQFCAHKVIGK